MVTAQTCSMCEEVKPVEEFSFRRKSAGDRHTRCKRCVSWANGIRRNPAFVVGGRWRSVNAFLPCLRCGVIKDAEEFPTVIRNIKRKRSCYCRACLKTDSRQRSRRYKYGIPYDEFLGMLRTQEFACPICKEPIDTSAHVDHDHKCCPGKKSCGECVRSLLCGPCNRLLGTARDSTDILRNAIDYLTGV